MLSDRALCSRTPKVSQFPLGTNYLTAEEVCNEQASYMQVERGNGVQPSLQNNHCSQLSGFYLKLRRLPLQVAQKKWSMIIKILFWKYILLLSSPLRPELCGICSRSSTCNVFFTPSDKLFSRAVISRYNNFGYDSWKEFGNWYLNVWEKDPAQSLEPPSLPAIWKATYSSRKPHSRHGMFSPTQSKKHTFLRGS